MPNKPKRKKARYQGRKTPVTSQPQVAAVNQIVIPGAVQAAPAQPAVRKVQPGPLQAGKTAPQAVPTIPPLGRELSFIGILSAVIVIALITLYFVLT